MLLLEVLGLIFTTIETLSRISDVYKVSINIEGLPKTFHKVVERLPLIQDILQSIAKHIETNAEEEDYQAIKVVMEKCKVKAERLEEIFNFVAPQEFITIHTRYHRYLMVVQRLGKGNQLEVLATEMMGDLHFLAQNRTVKAATPAQLARLGEAIEDLLRMPLSLPDEDLINSDLGIQCMDNRTGFIHSTIGFRNTFSGSAFTLDKGVQETGKILSLGWEIPWLGQSSRNPCPTEDCVLPNGHLSSHETWKPCTMQDCSRHQGHEGDHRMRSEELSKIDARFQKRAKDAEKVSKELADSVLEAMGYPQPEGLWRSKMAKTIIASFGDTKKNALILSPSLPRGEPSSPYRKFVLHDRQIRLFQLDPTTMNSNITGSFICVELSTRPVYTALSYTWGDGRADWKITILGQGELAIRESLWSFLRLQGSIITEPTLFWIDAICIDQANIHERNHQVGLMRQIYTSAAKVYVWLGQEDENSSIAVRFVAA